MPDERPTAFVDLKRSDFPFLIEFIDRETQEAIWSYLVEEARALDVPSASSLGSSGVRVRITYPDGIVESAGGDAPEPPEPEAAVP
jgi:hypothetical protein